MSATAKRIEELLRERLSARHLELRDESARHAGHPGAASGGGHYSLLIVSEAFEGRKPLERHRMVYETLADLMGRQIHALSMRTLTPAEWSG
jgi:BolA protein